MPETLLLDIEALIFASERSTAEEELLEILLASGHAGITIADVQEGINEVKKKYDEGNFAIRVHRVAGGYQFLTDKAHYQVINQLQLQRSKKKLSQAAMETLAIVAYRQPVTKAEIEHIRGVNSDYTVQKLLEKELIRLSGKSEGPGKPLLYSTSPLFMDYFGINSADELPRMKDMGAAGNEIGSSGE